MLSDAIFLTDAVHNITTWNKSCTKLYGYLAEQAIGQPVSMLLTPEVSSSFIDRLNHLPGKGPVEMSDQRITIAGGAELSLDFTVAATFDNSGNHNGSAIVARKVKTQLASDAMLHSSNNLIRMTFERATDFAIITFDTSAKITSWSKGAELIFGYSEKEAIGQHTSLIFTPEDVARGIDVQELVTARDKGRAEDERWHIGKSGNRFFMSGVMIAVLGNDNTLIGYAKVARDITKRKILEEQKDDFIKIASHELKTPVTTVKAFTEILLDRFKDNEDQQSAHMLRLISTQVNRLIQLIHTLLDSTRLNNGDLPLDRREMDLNHLIAEEISDLSALSQKHQLIFNPGKVPPISVDRRLISQVLVNLVTNAIKYSPDSKDIIITTYADDYAVTVSVQDFGMGIPSSAGKKIFERYFRVAANNKDGISGIGLGLFITERIIRRHGGQISVKSKEGEGALFEFSLPYNPDHSVV